MHQGLLQPVESGYLTQEQEATVSQQFTQVEVLLRTDVTVIARGIRHGLWYLLKALRPELAGQVMYQQMLVKEFGILMELNHPGVVQGVDFCKVDPLGNCIVMEWIEGETLEKWLIDHTDQQSHRRVVDQLLDAVAHIHSRGIAHRDLKPANIMLTDNGQQVKVIDFGLADTDAHATLKQPAGTLSYMSPEQMAGCHADVRNDIYSLGVIMRQLNLPRVMRRLAEHCLRPISERPQCVEQLQQSIARQDARKKWMTRTVAAMGVVVLMALSALFFGRMQPDAVQMQATTDSLQKLRGIVAKLDSQIVQQSVQAEVKAAEQQRHIQSLNSDLFAVTAVSQTLQQTQAVAAHRRQLMEASVQQGKNAIDQAMQSTHLMEHLDTLTNSRYLRRSYSSEMNASWQALNHHMASIQEQFDISELSAIRKQLEDHMTNVWLIPIHKKMEKIPWK